MEGDNCGRRYVATLVAGLVAFGSNVFLICDNFNRIFGLGLQGVQISFQGADENSIVLAAFNGGTTEEYIGADATFWLERTDGNLLRVPMEVARKGTVVIPLPPGTTSTLTFKLLKWPYNNTSNLDLLHTWQTEVGRDPHIESPTVTCKMEVRKNDLNGNNVFLQVPVNCRDAIPLNNGIIIQMLPVEN